MKNFRCWYLKERIGWLCFEMQFESKQKAIDYCEMKTDYKGSSIVEEI